MNVKTKKNLGRNLLITQIFIYAFITVHSVLWYVFHIHVLTKLCPFVFGEQIGSLEFNFAMIFWVLVFISTLFLGRAFCAWGCMFGAFQDFASRLSKKLKIKPLETRKGKWLFRFVVLAALLGYLLTTKNYWPTLFWFTALVVTVGFLTWLLLGRKSVDKSLNTLPKYILLVQYLGGIIALWISLSVFQKGITFVFDKYELFSANELPAQIALATFIAFCIAFVEKRVFCKYLCPIGMLLRLTSAIPFPKKFKVRATSEKCIQCGKCNKECLMGIDPMGEINRHQEVKDPNCINCLQCVASCPKNAIDFSSKPNASAQKTLGSENVSCGCKKL